MPLFNTYKQRRAIFLDISTTHTIRYDAYITRLCHFSVDNDNGDNDNDNNDNNQQIDQSLYPLCMCVG